MAAEDYIPEMGLDLIDPGQVDGDDALAQLRWRSKDGSFTRIIDMADSHLRNTALMLMGMGYQKYNAPDNIKVKWLTIFRMEWERRMRDRNEQHKLNRQ